LKAEIEKIESLIKKARIKKTETYTKSFVDEREEKKIVSDKRMGTLREDDGGENPKYYEDEESDENETAEKKQFDISDSSNDETDVNQKGSLTKPGMSNNERN